MTPERARRLSPLVSSVPVTDVMNRPVVTVDPEMGLLDLMRLFVTAGIGAAPVVDASGAPMGVVSKTDILRELYDQVDSSARPSLDAGRLESGQARRMMTASPVVVTEGASLADAARIMAEEHLHRVFVVDQRGAITGVLSSSDIVQWLANRDEDENG